MAYTPTTWTTGDTITASAMNKIENGIAGAGGALICNSSYSNQASNFVLDKTVQEIYDALLSGTPAYIKFQYGTISDFIGTLYLAPIVKVYNYDSTNVIRIVAIKPQGTFSIGGDGYSFGSATLIYSASAVNEYPSFLQSVYVNTNAQTSGGNE